MDQAGLVQTSSHALARLLGDWSSGPGPAHRRLSDLIRLLILDGRLPLATTMPGERDLAAVLRISRTTVSTAYATLREQGYLSATARSRSRTRVPPPARTPWSVRHDIETSRHSENLTSGDGEGDGVADFSFAAPPAPGEALHRAYSRALDQLPRHLPRHGYARAGLPELRAAIADRYTARGLPTTAEQILVTNGALNALVVVARTLLRPRDRVVVDHPSYPHALQAFRDAGCRIVPVALTDDGWDLDGLVAATRGAALAYLLPDFHNPTGLCMPAPDRRRLRLDCQAVIDETMADLALDIAPPVPFAAYHPHAITIGSADKTFWGGLRVGWIRANVDLVHQLRQARTSVDLGTPIVEQLACVELLSDLDQILPSRLADLRERRTLLLELVAEHLPDWTIGPSYGGLSVWARLPQPISSALAAVAPDFGVRLAAGPRFGVGGAFERFVRLPYAMDAEAMTAGVASIARAVAAVRGGRRSDAGPADLV